MCLRHGAARHCTTVCDMQELQEKLWEISAGLVEEVLWDGSRAGNPGGFPSKELGDCIPITDAN